MRKRGRSGSGARILLDAPVDVGRGGSFAAAIRRSVGGDRDRSGVVQHRIGRGVTRERVDSRGAPFRGRKGRHLRGKALAAGMRILVNAGADVRDSARIARDWHAEDAGAAGTRQCACADRDRTGVGQRNVRDCRAIFDGSGCVLADADADAGIGRALARTVSRRNGADRDVTRRGIRDGRGRVSGGAAFRIGLLIDAGADSRVGNRIGGGGECRRANGERTAVGEVHRGIGGAAVGEGPSERAVCSGVPGDDNAFGVLNRIGILPDAVGHARASPWRAGS